jgi:MFS transporter, DHA1 family, inner membrane transport protein
VTATADESAALAAAALPKLTLGKWIANTALRWVPPFLPTLEKAFGASTTQLTTILGASEIAGLSTVAVGRHLDRGRERIVLLAGLVAVIVASLVALVGTTFTFAIGSVLVIMGVANITVAGHSFISSRVPYERRARTIGVYETSWALALLIGAPIIAVLISIFGWRGPYVTIAVVAAIVTIVVARSAAITRPPRPAAGADEAPSIVPPPGKISAVTGRAWLTIAGAAFVAMAGLSVFAISGSWLDDAFGVPTGGLGAVAMGFGAVELLSSLSSAAFADRIGKLRGTVSALMLLIVGAVVMLLADSTLWIGVVGILLFLCGFEFAIVTSFSLVSEAMPSARGTTLALSNGIGTVARGTATIVGGWLYGIHGVSGTLTLSIGAATLSAIAFTASRSRFSRP